MFKGFGFKAEQIKEGATAIARVRLFSPRHEKELRAQLNKLYKKGIITGSNIQFSAHNNIRITVFFEEDENDQSNQENS